MKVLWVKSGSLVPPDTGGKIRSYNLIRELARKHEVTLFTFYTPHAGDKHAELEKFYFCRCGAENCRGTIMKPPRHVKRTRNHRRKKPGTVRKASIKERN